MLRPGLAAVAASLALLATACTTPGTDEPTLRRSPTAVHLADAGGKLPQAPVGDLGDGWREGTEHDRARVCEAPLLTGDLEHETTFASDPDGREATLAYLRVSDAAAAVADLYELVDSCSAHVSGILMQYAWLTESTVPSAVAGYVETLNDTTGETVDGVAFAAAPTAQDVVALVEVRAAEGYDVEAGTMPKYADAVLEQLVAHGTGSGAAPVAAFADLKPAALPEPEGAEDYVIPGGSAD